METTVANTLEVTQRLELRDASGSVLNTFLPQAAVQEALTECQTLRKQLAELREENARLRREVEVAQHRCQEMNTIQVQRDDYRQVIRDLTGIDPYFFNSEELRKMEANALTMDQLIDGMTAAAGAIRSGAGHG
jgi:DNA repair ATPase RecN